MNLSYAQGEDVAFLKKSSFQKRPISKVEMLQLQLKKESIDTAKINLLRNICREYIDTDHQKLKKFALTMLNLSARANDQAGKADAYNFLGIAEDINSHFNEALIYYKKALPLAKASKKTVLIASVLNNIGLLEWKAGDYKEALSTFFSALKCAESVGAVKIQGNICSNIGLVYQELNQKREALLWQKKALALRKRAGNDYGLASNYNNLANAYSIMGKQDSALSYQEKAISLQTKIGDQYGLGISYLNAGEEYKKVKNYRRALWYYEKSKSIREKEQDSLGLSYTYLNLADCYKEMGNLKPALFFGEKALQVSKKLQSDERIAESSKSLAEIYRLSGNLNQSVLLQQQYTDYQGKVFSDEMINKAAFLNVKYETEKKEKELNATQLKISKEILASKQKNIWLIILAAFLIVGLVIFRGINLKSRLKHKQLALENDLLQEQSISKVQQQRLEISRNLHDSLGSHLTLMSGTLDGLNNMIDTENNKVTDKVGELSMLVADSMNELRNTLWMLHAETVDLHDLHFKILSFVNRASDTRTDVEIKYTFELPEDKTLGSKIAAQIFRTLQEIINNALKHSNASLIEVNCVQEENYLTIMISDNGKGFDAATEKNKSYGLSNIHARIEEISGKIELETSIGKGTKYTLSIPC